MKAGAFGRQPERRQAQPGGRVLPGMFSSPSPSPAPTATPSSQASASPSSRPPPSSSAPPKLANASGALLSSWGTNGRGRLPGNTPSRLERLAREDAGGRSGSGDSDALSRSSTASSISRARQLGLNRRARTPSPPSSPEYSPERSMSRSPSPPAPQRRPRGSSQAAPSPFTRQRDRQTSTSPPRTRPRRSSSPPPVGASAVPSSAGESEQPQGLLSSLWGRATQLVGGAAAGQQPTVREVGHARANSVDSSLPAPMSTVTPFHLHDGAQVAHDEHEQPDEPHAPSTAKEQATLRNTRPIALPPLVGPARAVTSSSMGASRRVSVPPGVARAASAPLPPIEPITYHRPPPLYPRDSLLAQRRRTTEAQASPYDWLESRDEAPLEPFLFTRAVGRAPTRRGGRAARRPAMPASARTEPGPRAGVIAAAAAGGAAAAVATGGMARMHGQPGAGMTSIPSLARPAFSYTPPVHPGAPPASPLPPGYAGPQPATSMPPPTPMQPAYTMPVPSAPPPAPAAPAPTWPAAVAASSAVPAAAAAAPLAGIGIYGQGDSRALAPASANDGVSASEPLPSYEPRASTEETRRPHAEGGTAELEHQQGEVPLARSGTGPDSLPIFPSPSNMVSQPPPASMPQVSGPSATSSQASYDHPSYAMTSQPAQVAPLVPPAPLPSSSLAPSSSIPSTSQTYHPAESAAPQYYSTAPMGSASSVSTGSAPAPASSSAGAHYAAHFPSAGPSPSTVLPRLFASTLPSPAPTAAATTVPRSTPPSAPSSAAPSSSAALAGHGDLPPGPPILPITPPPIPAVSHAPHGPPTSQSLYPAHLAAMQGPQGALAQTSWAAAGRPVPPLPGGPLQSSFFRLPSPAAPSPSPTLHAPTPVVTSTEVSAVPDTSKPEEEEELPPYVPPSDGAIGLVPGTSEKEALVLPPHTAPETPLPPSPAPPALPAPPPVPPLPSASPASPPVPARQPSLVVSTAASPPPPPAAALQVPDPSQIVLTPPTPIEPHSVASSAVPLVVAEEGPAAVDDAPPTDTSAPLLPPEPLPALQPLELGFTLDDLGLGALDFGLGLEAPTEPPTEEGERKPLPWPERASSPAVQFGDDVDEEEDDYDDPAADTLDEAFDAATSFVTSFAEADLARARVDPGHSARTERWLQQQGVERKPVEQLRTEVQPEAAGPAMVEQSPTPGLFRPRTAPPASVAPGLLTPGTYTPSATHTRAAPTSISRPASATPAQARVTPLTYRAQLAFLSTLRESTSDAEGDDDAAPSTLETSIGLPEAALHRARAVSVDEVARAAEVERATVEKVLSVGEVQSDAAFGGSASDAAQEETVVVPPQDKGKGRAQEVDEPLTGDKGETASEVAAMFANW